MANPELGAKQICPVCSSKFYDLNRRPAHCPKCDAEFDPEEAFKTRVRSRSRTAPADYEDQEDAAPKPAVDEDAEELEEADETPEIDQAADDTVLETDDDSDPTAPPAPAEDLGVDFEEESDVANSDDDDDVPFLEDEEGDDFPDDDLSLPDEGDAEER